jgi:acyl-coenzyme A thioesterase PaaI-like protein
MDMTRTNVSDDQVTRLRRKAKHCYVCGPENASGLHVSFVPDGDNGSRAVYIARPEHEGWPGILHGGVTFALMDEALGWALYFRGLNGVTARITTRFRAPITIGTSLVVRGWTIEQRRRIVTVRAEIRGDSEGNPLLAEADATMYLLDGLDDKAE